MIKPKNVFRNENEITEEMKKGLLPQIVPPEERCPEGYHLVLDYFKNRKGDHSMALEIEGIYVPEHCARNPKPK